MSAGGQRGIDVSGAVTTRLISASDYTTQVKSKLVYQTFNSTTGANAYGGDVPNGNDYYLQFLKGVDDCGPCAGLPYQKTLAMKFR